MSESAIKLSILIQAQITHLRNVAYADGQEGEPSGRLDRVHERLGAMILAAMKTARKQDTDLIRQMLEALEGVVTQVKYYEPVTAAITAARARLGEKEPT